MIGDVIWLVLMPAISGAIGGAVVAWLIAAPKLPQMPTWASYRDWKGE